MTTGPNYRPNIQLPNLMGGTGNPYDLNLYPQDMIWEKPEGWNESSLSGMTGKTAFLPSDKRHGILQTLDNQVQEGLFMNEQNKKQYQDLLRQDTEGFNKGKWDRTLPADRYVNAGNVMNDASNFGLFSHANAEESDGQYLMDKENFDYNALYGDNYSDLKIPGINEPRIPYRVGREDSGQRYRDYNQKRNMGSVLQSGIDKDPYNYNHPRFDWATYPDTDLSPQELAQELDQLETIDPYGNDPYGTEHHYITPDKSSFSFPNFGLSGILKGLKNQFEYKGAENTAFDPNTGQYLTAEEQDKLNARGGWYSDAARYDRRQRKRVANMLHRRDVLKKAINDKRLEEMIKKGYGEDKTITPPSSGPGTKAVYEEHGWTQPTYHEDSFTSPRDSESAFGGDFSGAGPSRHARGGRVRYSTGGRVGILSVF